MICSFTCGISLMFLVGMIYMINSVDKSKLHKKFTRTLDDEQHNIYKKIVEERRSIHQKGFLLGLFISILVILYNYNQKKVDNLSLACLVASISFTTQYFYYILSKKSDWMILHLKNKTQTKAWLKIYKTMQNKYHTGIVLGIIFVILLSWAFKC